MFKSSGLYEGKQIYLTRCQTCHGCAGNGLGTYGGTMVVTPVNYKQEPFRAMPDDEWIWHVKEGVPGTLMPVWKESLTDEQIWRVIDYAQQMFAQPFYHDPDEGDAPPPYADMENPLHELVRRARQRQGHLHARVPGVPRVLGARRGPIPHGPRAAAAGPRRRELRRLHRR